MKRSLVAILFTSGLLTSARVGADTWEAHGLSCQPDKNDLGSLEYSPSGVFNTSTSATPKVYCPIEYISDLHPIDFNTTTIKLRYVDRATSDKVTCVLTINLFDGQTIFSETKTSPVGASDDTQTFQWSIGTQIGGARQLSIKCTLPKAGSSSGARSGIRGITLDTNV